ncbi:MAG: hypothetical protein LRY71_08030 [Bacillaceae bacterium]|nr:hypothetical protein [Bacillaceae bacterium]
MDLGAKKKAESFINETALLFAGGELSEEDQDKVFKAITEIYWLSKEKNKKYIPKKIPRYRKIVL